MCPSSPRGAAWRSALGRLEDVRRAALRPPMAVLGALQCRCERAGRWTAVLRILDLMQGGDGGEQNGQLLNDFLWARNRMNMFMMAIVYG